MLIVGCDYHPSVQQIAFVDTETGDYGEQRLKHSDGEAEKFYRDLKLRGVNVRSAWKLLGIRDGSSACSVNWATSCGPEMRLRLQLCGFGSRRPIDEMLSFC